MFESLKRKTVIYISYLRYGYHDFVIQIVVKSKCQYLDLNQNRHR